MKTKIYLAKSNRANPDHVQMVRKTIKEFDVEVVEYTGGAYTHKPLLTCDMLLVIPELETSEDDYEYVPLGKGLHEQISIFQQHVTNKCDLLIVYKCDEIFGPSITGLDDIDFADADDYVNYSTAVLDENNGVPLRVVLTNRFGVSYSSPKDPNRNNKYRLLIK